MHLRPTPVRSQVRGAHQRKAATAKRANLKAQPGQRLAMLFQQGQALVVKLQAGWKQQALRGQRRALMSSAQTLKHHPLVGSVLVNQHQLPLLLAQEVGT